MLGTYTGWVSGGRLSLPRVPTLWNILPLDIRFAHIKHKESEQHHGLIKVTSLFLHACLQESHQIGCILTVSEQSNKGFRDFGEGNICAASYCTRTPSLPPFFTPYPNLVGDSTSPFLLKNFDLEIPQIWLYHQAWRFQGNNGILKWFQHWN